MQFRDWLKKCLAVWARDTRGARPESLNSEVEGGVDPFNPLPEPVAVEIRDFFDLHAVAPRDVRRVVEEYLYQARRAGFRSVRIIHGKGVGVQRGIVRGVLARTPFVEDWTDAPPEAGGWGATIVILAPGGEDD